MRYISWAAFYEGASDSLYLDVLLPRLIREVVACEGTHLVEVPDNPAVRLGERGRSVAEVAKEVCGFREALDVIVVHAGHGRSWIAARPAGPERCLLRRFQRPVRMAGRPVHHDNAEP